MALLRQPRIPSAMHFGGLDEPSEADHRGGCRTVRPVLLENEAMGQEGVRADTCPQGLPPLWVIGSPQPALACSSDPAEMHVTSAGATHCKEQHAFPFIPGDGRGVGKPATELTLVHCGDTGSQNHTDFKDTT